MAGLGKMCDAWQEHGEPQRSDWSLRTLFAVIAGCAVVVAVILAFIP